MILSTGWGTVEENQIWKEGISGFLIDLVLVLVAVDVTDFTELLVEGDSFSGLLVEGGKTLFDSFWIVISSFFLAFSGLEII